MVPHWPMRCSWHIFEKSARFQGQHQRRKCWTKPVNMTGKPSAVQLPSQLNLSVPLISRRGWRSALASPAPGHSFLSAVAPRAQRSLAHSVKQPSEAFWETGKPQRPVRSRHSRAASLDSPAPTPACVSARAPGSPRDVQELTSESLS